MRTYKIPEMNIENLRKKVAKIEGKCKKYGCDFRYAELGEEYEKIKGLGVVKFIEIEVEGVAQIDNWVLVAKLERIETGNIIRQIDFNVDVPRRYFDCDLVCDHCNTRRIRNNTYLVYNADSDEFKQVGSTCLKDYTGISAEIAAAFASFIRDVEEEFQNVGSSGSSCDPYISIKDALKYAYDYVNHVGYHRSDEPDSTRHQVWAALVADSMIPGGGATQNAEREVTKYRNTFVVEIDSDATINFVNDCVDYFATLEDSYSSYMNNLHLLAKLEYIRCKDLGLVVSMVPTYQKYLAREETKRAYKNTYIGEEGEKIEIRFKRCKFITGWETQFGYTCRYMFITENDEVVMWDASRGIEQAPSSGILRGTIKKLDIYNGIYQTWVTRCKIQFDSMKEDADVHLKK